jgi:hypothetical protein
LIKNYHKIVFFMTLLLFAVVNPSLVLAAQIDAEAALASAKEQFIICYQASIEAEKAGANITSLTAVLNDAGEVLNQAEYTYSIGDFDVARDLAVQSSERLGGLISEANVLREIAVQQRNSDFLYNVVGSIVGTFAVIGGGLMAWFLLKRKFGQFGEGANESSKL